MSAIFGIIAKTAHGKAVIRGGATPHLLPSTFPQQKAIWWFSEKGGVALSCAGMLVEQESEWSTTVLCIDSGQAGENQHRNSQLESPKAEIFRKDLQGESYACLSRTKGRFSLMFWQGETLLLARDHLGQKSLFFQETEHLFFLCSNLEPLLKNTMVSQSLDVESAHHYLSFGTPFPGKTLMRHISSIPAGHYAIWRPLSRPEIRPYYSPLSERAELYDKSELERTAIETLDSAIIGRVRNGSQALLLSSGVDSSYIASTLSKFDLLSDIQAYTVSFSGVQAENNEDQAASDFARSIGLQHEVVTMSSAEALPSLSAILELPEPCSAWSSVTHNHLMQRMRNNGHQYCLSGVGSDEVFGGYLDFHEHDTLCNTFLKNSSSQQNISSIDMILRSPNATSHLLFPGISGFFDQEARQKALCQPFRDWEAAPYLTAYYRNLSRLKPEAELVEYMVSHECQHRIPELLFRSFEGVGGQVGVDTSYPFLDPAVVNFACSLGMAERFWIQENRWKTKKLMRTIAGYRIPKLLIDKTPQSYNAPFLLWMKDETFRASVEAYVEKSTFWNLGLVRPDYFEDVRRGIKELTLTQVRRREYAFQYWSLLTLCAWCDRYLTSTSKS